jgi:hypothetical protein
MEAEASQEPASGNQLDEQAHIRIPFLYSNINL